MLKETLHLAFAAIGCIGSIWILAMAGWWLFTFFVVCAGTPNDPLMGWPWLKALSLWIVGGFGCVLMERWKEWSMNTN